MATENSTNDIFRFMQIRPVKPADEARPIPLLTDTPLARNLFSAPSVERRATIANAALVNSAETVQSLESVPLSTEITTLLFEFSADPTATVDDLLSEFPEFESVFP